MDLIKCSERLPELSFIESDNKDDPYAANPVLVFCPESPGIMCVAWLEKEQDQKNMNYGILTWVLYIPRNSSIEVRNFKTFTHWMPLPENPRDYNGLD